MGGPPGYDPLLLTATPFALSRPPRDRAWGIALITVYVGCLVSAIFAYQNMYVVLLRRASPALRSTQPYTWVGRDSRERFWVVLELTVPTASFPAATLTSSSSARTT